MNTIKEAAHEYFRRAQLHLAPAGSEYGFVAGVEFAQRWISVEEELPPIGEMVITKMGKRHGDTWVQHYYSTATRLENQGEWQDVNWVDHSMSFGHITHWRPIDLK